jgi:hypothetical protein
MPKVVINAAPFTAGQENLAQHVETGGLRWTRSSRLYSPLGTQENIRDLLRDGVLSERGRRPPPGSSISAHGDVRPG